jgi:hypothetical protein
MAGVKLDDVKPKIEQAKQVMRSISMTARGTADYRSIRYKLDGHYHDLAYMRDELTRLLNRGADLEPWPMDDAATTEKYIYWRRALVAYEHVCDVLREMEQYRNDRTPETQTTYAAQTRFGE